MMLVYQLRVLAPLGNIWNHSHNLPYFFFFLSSGLGFKENIPVSAVNIAGTSRAAGK
jgi:hypothetical protein